MIMLYNYNLNIHKYNGKILNKCDNFNIFITPYVTLISII